MDLFQAAIERISKQKKRRKKRNQYMPNDPQLSKSVVENPSYFKNWRSKRIHFSNNGKQEDLYNLLNKTHSLTSNPNDFNGFDQVHHLLSRASFGNSVDEIDAIKSLTTEQIVETLLAETELPNPPGEWVYETFNLQEFEQLTPEQQEEFFILNYDRINELRSWWFERMLESSLNLREKMTLFWSGHFTTDIESAFLAQFLYVQNNTLRKNALGNFRTFLKEIYKDPAMLLYLDGVNNISEEPNENFARELLELFTMGVGNYTEDDIKEAARAFTGWQVNPYNLNSFFNPLIHDHGIKDFMGQSGNFDGDKIIDIILEQPHTATYICTKLYEAFVGRELNQEFIDELADVFRSNGYEIKPVLRRMFTSDYFYSSQSTASLIKSPIELMVSNVRLFSVQSINVYFLIFATALIDQELMSPPNVAGWPGQRSWISPTTYVTRNTLSEIVINPDLLGDEPEGPLFEFNPMDFALSFEIDTVQELAEAMTKHLLRIPVDENTMDFLVSVLLGSANPEDWSLNYPGVKRLVSEFLIQVVRLPEFHLG